MLVGGSSLLRPFMTECLEEVMQEERSLAFLISLQRLHETDELGKKSTGSVITVPDFHATIHAAMGIDPAKNLYAGSRPVPITDRGKPVPEAFS